MRLIEHLLVGLLGGVLVTERRAPARPWIVRHPWKKCSLDVTK